MSFKSSTIRLSWTQVRRWVDEAIDMAQGTGETPALAVEDHDDQRYLILKLEHAQALLTDEARPERKPSRAEVVKDIARTPVLLRDDEDE